MRTILIAFALLFSNVCLAEQPSEYVKVTVEVQKGYEYVEGTPVMSLVNLGDGIYYPTAFTSLKDVKVDKIVDDHGNITYRLSSTIKRHKTNEH